MEELSIRGNNLGLSAVREVLRAVRRATAVTSLDLREIYDARHKDLTELVKDLRHVTCLDGIKMPPKRAAWKVGPTEIAGEHVAAFLANAALANKVLALLLSAGSPSVVLPLALSLAVSSSCCLLACLVFIPCPRDPPKEEEEPFCSRRHSCVMLTGRGHAQALTSLDLRGTRMCPDLLRSLQSALRHRPDIALHL